MSSTPDHDLHNDVRERIGILHLVAGGFEAEWGGEEEDELAPGDGRREGGRVEEVGVEQPQPLGRAGDQPPQHPRLLLVSCMATG